MPQVVRIAMQATHFAAAAAAAAMGGGGERRQILTLSFFGDCRSNAKRALLGPSVCNPSPAWTANTDPIRTPNADGPNPYDTTVAAQVPLSPLLTPLLPSPETDNLFW